MKKLTFVFLSFLFTNTFNAQQTPPNNNSPTLEKNLYGIQLNTIGVNGFYERRLANTWSAKAEVGLRGSLAIYSSDSYFHMQPEVGLQVRHYYNLKSRAKKGKNTRLNSGNFIALGNRYINDSFGLFNTEDRLINASNFTHINWGLRRSYGELFFLEFGAGLGYYKEFNLEPWQDDDSGVSIYLDFKIGFQF